MHRPGPDDEHRMLCTPPPRCRALPGRCRASSGVHSVRASGAVAPTEWGPLRTMSSTLGPVVRTAVRTVRGGGAVVRTRCGVVVRIGCAAAGMVRAPSGAWRVSRRAARSEWRAMPPPRGAVSSRVPISHSPLSAVRPESRMCDMGPARVGQVTRNGFECGSGGRAPRPRPGGAHLLGQAVRWGAHRGCGAPAWVHRCAHHRLPCAHRGAVAGECDAPRCAPVRRPGVNDIVGARTMPFTVIAGARDEVHG